MRKILMITGQIYPLTNGARLHTYGYCSEFAKISDFRVYSLYRDELPIEQAEAEMRKDFEGRLFVPNKNLFLKLLNGFNIIEANKLFMYPIYREFYAAICECIEKDMIDTVIIDHVAMGFYFRKLKQKYPNITFVYNSHNVEYMNIYDRHVKYLEENEDGVSQTSYKEMLKRYQDFRDMEKELLSESDYVFDISLEDIKILSEEYKVPVEKMLLAKPLIQFPLTKKEESISKFYKKLLMVGSMSWYPNEHGIIWFIENVFAKLIELDEEYSLYLVGRGATQRIEQLADKYSKNIKLVGAVPSTDEYFEECDLSIVPVFEGTGAKLKVLESLARGIPTVCSTFAAKDYGIEEQHMKLCSTEEEFLQAILDLSNDATARKDLYINMKEYMENYYKLNDEIYEVLA